MEVFKNLYLQYKNAKICKLQIDNNIVIQWFFTSMKIGDFTNSSCYFRA